MQLEKMKGEKSQITRKGYKRLKEGVQDDGLMAKKGCGRSMDRKIREERKELPKKVRDDVQECTAMMQEELCDRYRRGVVEERVVSIETGDWEAGLKNHGTAGFAGFFAGAGGLEEALVLSSMKLVNV